MYEKIRFGSSFWIDNFLQGNPNLELWNFHPGW